MNDFVVTEDMYAGLGRNFVADVFAAGNGYFKTSSLGGVQHIAKVVKRSTPVAKAKVATLTIAVVPSVDTETELAIQESLEKLVKYCRSICRQCICCRLYYSTCRVSSRTNISIGYTKQSSDYSLGIQRQER